MNVALLIIGYDGYVDVWDSYFELLNKYWPSTIRPKTYLVTSVLHPNYDGVEVISAGENSEWSNKARTALEQINEDYVVLLLEDFFTTRNVDGKKLEHIVNLMEDNNLTFCRILDQKKMKGKHFKKEKHIKIIPSSLIDEDGVVQTNYRMVIGWSEKRYREDMFKIEMHEQGAREAIAHHAKLPLATFGWKKYIETGKNKAQKINEKKLAKDKKLAGYYAYLFKDSREFDKEWVKLPAEEKKELSGWEIIEQYKKQAQIEECFRIMKTNFNLRPMYVYTDEHIEAQVLICVLALILLRILSKKLKLAGSPMTTEQILAALNTAKLSVQLDKEQPALYRPLRQILRRPKDDDPHAPIHLYEETDLSRIMNCVDLTPLPPVADKNELAHCLKTRFDTDKEALGAVYQI